MMCFPVNWIGDTMAAEVAMIELTQEQHEAVAGGDTRVRDCATNESYVLVREAVFDRLKALLDGDTVYTTAEMLDAVMAEDDANDPALAYYQQKYGT
jgi:hypothetical protein